jgi:hypothetical protein
MISRSAFLLQLATISSFVIGGTSFLTPTSIMTPPSASAFAMSNGGNNNINSNNEDSNTNTGNSNNQNNDDFNFNNNFKDGNTYGFADGTTFSMMSKQTKPIVAYKSISMEMPDFDGVKVPVAVWYKPDINYDSSSTSTSSSSNSNKNQNEDDQNTNDQTNYNNYVPKKKLIMDFPTIATSIPSTESTESTPGIGASTITTTTQVSFSSQSLDSSSNTRTKQTSSSSSLSSSTTSDSTKNESNKDHTAIYKHRISVKKIGSMLGGLNFIPEFFSKDFTLYPTSTTSTVIDSRTSTTIGSGNGTSMKSYTSTSMPKDNTKPVIILAHGFLGSRFDLSHLGEELASQGFIVLSPEYPESLASSYESTKKIDTNGKKGNGNGNDNGGKQEEVIKMDRAMINERLLTIIESESELNLKPKSYGIVGHSLGTGTVMTTGDDSWTRVCIAGPPKRRDGVIVRGNILAIASVNDGAVTMSRMASMIPESFVRLDESSIVSAMNKNSIDDPSLNMMGSSSYDDDDKMKLNLDLPSKSMLVIDREDAPNHISFLAGNVNDSMVSFLSPLLPVAQALQIPVLDFDKYKESRDSVATANIVVPLVSSFLRQYMMP